jgi:DNA-binding NarL/FixJ family response regulator
MSNDSKIKVLLVDDHQVVREGLRRIVQMDEGIEVVGEAKSGEEAVIKAASLRPNVVVMDLKMPGMDGIAATREIKRQLPEVNVLVLTLYAEDFIKQAIEAGASGYLLKDSDTDQITSAIHQVYNGLSPIALSITRDLVMEFAKISKSYRAHLLTNRQVEVLKLISEGVSSREIGEQLFISPSTEKREIRHIFNKLGVSDRSHAVSQAIKRQLI